MRGLSAAFTTDFLIAFAVVTVILIMFGLIMNLYSELSSLRKRYRKMMMGAEDMSIERMLAEHTAEVNDALNENKKFHSKLNNLDELVRSSLARVAVIHFDAFEQTGQNLSWCVAILDRNNNGVVFSSICGQEAERNYAKPIEGGRTTANYKLTKEEEQAIRQAMNR
ncbi:MAG: DUF4446 family protein [Selenomonadaceae bacterium]|nr:DUF4446 family protein [Selenomonadaceae bacterium]